ncbi:hypothetical protein HIM_05644 [Hirsutella minnesotensis 3608]|uniref:HAUS augmin-like complex subunit 3 N-terminal domain-containing protein n=1 Tax=Hirsutella minnesotensis 3608 TaxID=1043627 RepID=A0A0F7ZUI3_9HYPO|nr:hypothetical protein HIM_05644 [Hirsutella minnesotensis 3608]
MATPTRDQAESLLSDAARTFGLQVTPEQVQAALDDPDHGIAFAEWATKHLVPDCLLSQNELELYAELDRSGQVDRLSALHDLAEVQAVTETELTAAVEELRLSSARIAQQTRTLRQQQDALSRLVGKRAEADARRQQLCQDRQRKTGAQLEKLTAEVDELSHDLGFRLSEVEQQCRDALPNITQLVDGVLKADDKLLASLQKLGWELEQPNSDEAARVEKLRETCMRLIDATAEAVRLKLDAAYLDALVDGEQSGLDKSVSSSEVKALEEEVESLYTELQPVAQMAVEKQHLEPAVRSVSAKTSKSMGRSVEALEYISDCLDYLLDRMDCLRIHLENHQSHHLAASAVATMARNELAITTQTPQKPSTQAQIASPTHKLSPIRMEPKSSRAKGHRRSSSFQEEPPLETLLQTLSISVPSLNAKEGKSQTDYMAKILTEREEKAAEVERSAHESFEQSIIARLRDAKLAVQLIRDSVLAESPFAEVKLVDPDIEASILVLEQEIGNARDRLSKVDATNIASRSEKRDMIVRRFGGS